MGQILAESEKNADYMQRALGEVDLAIASGSLRRCFQSGSAKLFLPKTYSDNIEAVLVNTAGGIAEGDGFKYRVQASDKTNITITTQAAERVYGAIASRVAHLNIDLTITCGTSLHWLPQETILFNNGRLARNLTVRMDESSTLLISEITVLGRKAMKERVRHGFLSDQWRIYRRDHLIHAEAVWLDGPIEQKLASVATASEMSCFATILSVGEGVEQRATSTRAYFDTIASVRTAISAWDGKLVIRCLADEARDIKAAISGCIRLLSGFPVPRVWNV